MDQWENWRFESKLGPVFVNISRKPAPGADIKAYDDVTSISVESPADRLCRRCDRKVESEQYSRVFEHMHYVCFHTATSTLTRSAGRVDARQGVLGCRLLLPSGPIGTRQRSL